jgi:hypothetical protein
MMAVTDSAMALATVRTSTAVHASQRARDRSDMSLSESIHRAGATTNLSYHQIVGDLTVASRAGGGESPAASLDRGSAGFRT